MYIYIYIYLSIYIYIYIHTHVYTHILRRTGSLVVEKLASAGTFDAPALVRTGPGQAEAPTSACEQKAFALQPAEERGAMGCLDCADVSPSLAFFSQ